MLEKVTNENFKSIEQMAEFFDLVDTQEMEWEDTNAKFVRPEMVHVSLRIPKEDLITLKKNAKNLGLGYTAYIRMLLHQLINNSK